MKDRNGKDLKAGDLVTIRARVTTFYSTALEVVTLPEPKPGREPRIGDPLVIMADEVEFVSREEEAASPLAGSLSDLKSQLPEG